MFLRVANDCDNRLTVQPSVGDFDFFDLTARFDLVCVDRAILILKTPKGPLRCLDHVYQCEGYGRALRRTMRTPSRPSRSTPLSSSRTASTSAG